MEPDKQLITELLKKVTYPGQKQDIVTQGKLLNVEVKGNTVSLQLASSPDEAKFKQAITDNVKFIFQKSLGTTCTVDIIFVESQLEGGISKVKNIVAIASGKGGVGKSTITVNLAISFARLGYKVGLIDADIFGPSIPRMFGVEGEIPYSREVNGKNLIIPVERYGVKLLSIGFFVKRQESLAWRGPMASGALKQLINDSDWGELDILLFDTPPGTSDIHLTILQSLPLTGAVIVTTPQDVAIIDAVRGIDLFRKENINVPILGLVENMSWFTPKELPDNRYYIFGKDGGQKLAGEYGLSLLGQIPIVQGIREGGDQGLPPAADPDTILHPIFSQLAENVLDALKKRNETLPETQQLKIHHK